MRTFAHCYIAGGAFIFIAVGCGSDDGDPPTSAQGGTGTTSAGAGAPGSAGAGGSEASSAQGGGGAGTPSNGGSGGSSNAMGGRAGTSAGAGGSNPSKGGTGGRGGTSAGAGGSNPSNGGTGGMPEAEPVEPQCEAFDVVNGGASERTNSALCFGLPDSPFCQTHPTAPYSHCETDVYWYEVEWYDVNGATYGNLYGNNFPETSGGPLVAVVHQAEDGSFRYVDPNTQIEIMFCTVVGDVANRCVWP
jgi:hypothetical protein